jgi:hypothetical protein
VYGLRTSNNVWTALASRFASQSKSHVLNLKRQLQTIRQGTKTCAEFVQTAKGWADELAVAGNPLDDEELIFFILGGLNPSFNAFISSFSLVTRDRSLSFSDFHDELLSHATLLQLQQVVANEGMVALYSNKNQGGPRPFSPRANKPTQHQMQQTHVVSIEGCS